MYPTNRRFFSRVASRFYLNASSLSLSFVLRAVKRLSRAHREDDDGDADADDDAFFSRAKFDGVVSALFYYTRPGKVSVFFCSKQQAKRRKIVTLQISLLNEISFPRKALFRLFVSSSIESHPQTVLKNFKVGFPTNETILFSGELAMC
jgi:hypothetical protein